MSSTYLSLHYHIIFSTKKRGRFIGDKWRPELHRYLGGVTTDLGGHCEIVGGTADHVHLLVTLWAKPSIPDFMRELKRASSLWAHRDPTRHDFAWQEGYAAVRRYIENQEEHHRERGFLEELRILLVRSGVKYDERYLN
jgi:REP element-mobilizing transposase RayT